MRSLTALALTGVLLLVSITSTGQIPRELSYQGLLTDDSGRPLINAPVSLVFRIYDAPSGGNQLWSESQVTSTGATGVISVVLGSTSPIDCDLGEPLWVELVVDGNTVSPRSKLTPSLYSLNASDAERLAGLEAGSYSLDGHNHDERYYTESELKISDGSGPNSGVNRVSWDNLVDVPSGFADGVDDGGTGGTGAWSVSGDDVYRQSGNVGVGIATPDWSLDVRSHLLYGLHVESDHLSAPDNTHVIHGEYTGDAQIPDGVGVFGRSVPGDGYGIGGVFKGGYIGVQGSVYPTGNDNYISIFGSTKSTVTVGTTYGSYGEARKGATSYGAYGFAYDAPSNYGVRGFAYGGTRGYGIYGSASGASSENWAGWFDGDVNVTGTVYGATTGFIIDHPLDPEREYLCHTAVQSSEMKNVYDGLVWLDGDGEAWVQLPEWFEALNGDFRYQLTPIGAPAPGLYVADTIENGRFRIAGGPPEIQVSWMVTGIRHDAYAITHSIEPERAKAASDEGKYLHPELFGRSQERGVGYAEPATLDSRR
jgi:hypothetical protein